MKRSSRPHQQDLYELPPNPRNRNHNATATDKRKFFTQAQRTNSKLARILFCVNSLHDLMKWRGTSHFFAKNPAVALKRPKRVTWGWSEAEPQATFSHLVEALGVVLLRLVVALGAIRAAGGLAERNVAVSPADGQKKEMRPKRSGKLQWPIAGFAPLLLTPFPLCGTLCRFVWTLEMGRT